MNLFSYYLNTIDIKDPRSVAKMDTLLDARRPKQYTDIMVDLETMDVIASAAVLSIGAVAFNLDEQESVKDYLYGVNCTARSFEITVDLGTQVQFDRRTISGGTLRWWLGQSDAARAAVSKKANPYGLRSRNSSDGSTEWSPTPAKHAFGATGQRSTTPSFGTLTAKVTSSIQSGSATTCATAR